MKVLMLLFLLIILTSSLKAQLLVICNKSIQSNTIDKNKLRKLYELSSFEFEGKRVVIFDINGDNPIKNSFYSYLGTNLRELKKIWLKVTLSGNGVPPISVANQEEMLERISSTPHSIGYIDKAFLNDKVKVLAQIPLK